MSRPTLAELRSEDMREWLDEHDAQVKAEALREAAKAMDADAYKMPASWLSERADAIEAGDPT